LNFLFYSAGLLHTDKYDTRIYLELVIWEEGENPLTTVRIARSGVIDPENVEEIKQNSKKNINW
jgi:hypothetical protein